MINFSGSNLPVQSIENNEDNINIDVNFQYISNTGANDRSISLYKLISENTANIIEYGQINELIVNLYENPDKVIDDNITLKKVFSRLYSNDPEVYSTILDFIHKYLNTIIASLVNKSLYYISEFEKQSMSDDAKIQFSKNTDEDLVSDCQEQEQPLFTGDEEEVFKNKEIEETTEKLMGEKNDNIKESNEESLDSTNIPNQPIYKIDKRILHLAENDEKVKNIVENFKNKAIDEFNKDPSTPCLELTLIQDDNGNNEFIEKRVDDNKSYSIYNISDKIIALSKMFPSILKVINKYKRKAMMEFIHPTDDAINTYLTLVAECNDNKVNIIENRLNKDTDDVINSIILLSFYLYDNDLDNNIIEEEENNKQIAEEKITEKYHHNTSSKSTKSSGNKVRKRAVKKPTSDE